MKRNFTLIMGNNNKRPANLHFICAEVTNTRLMGVFAVYIHWNWNETGFHQLFYFDSQEYGFESYSSLKTNAKEEVSVFKNRVIGGLGGELISISEKEAKYLVFTLFMYNKKNRLPLPAPEEEYAFLEKDQEVFSLEERADLLKKICITPSSSYEIINYYLMRIFDHDLKAITFLTGGRLLHDKFLFPRATLLANTVTEISPNMFSCESLIELDITETYKIVLSEIGVLEDHSHFIISQAECISSLDISPTEVSMLLNRREYISVYTIWDSEKFIEDFEKANPNTLKNTHENGILYIEFHPTNAHVGNPNFSISEDVKSVYYVGFSQVVVAAYDKPSIEYTENFLAREPLASSVIDVERFDFNDSVIYEFVQGGWSDFYQFLSDIGGDQ